MVSEHQKFMAAASSVYIGVFGLFAVLVVERWLTPEELSAYRRASFPLSFAVALAYEFVIRPSDWRAVFKSLLPFVAGIALLAVTR